MSPSKQVSWDSQCSVISFIRKLSNSLPAETSLQQRVAFASILDTLYSVSALIDGLIGDQGVSQVFIPICAVHTATITTTIPSHRVLLA